MSDHFLDNLEAYGAKEARGFQIYERQYIRQHPPPEPPEIKWHSHFPFMAFLFGAIAIAGLILAALRTAPVFIAIAELTVGGVFAISEGVLATVVIDFGMIAFRYAAVYLSHHKDPEKVEITWWVRGGGAFAFIAQLVAQAYAVREISGFFMSFEGLMQDAVAITAALSGMVLAFVTGEILAVLVLQSQAARRRVQGDYDRQVVAWRDALNAGWDADKVKYIGRPPASARTKGTARTGASVPAGQGRGQGEPSPSEAVVLKHLLENPQDKELSVRVLAAKVGKSKTVVGEALKLYKNGHGDNHG